MPKKSKQVVSGFAWWSEASYHKVWLPQCADCPSFSFWSL